MIYLTATTLIWAFSFGIIKLYLTGVDSSFVSAARILLSLLCFLPFWRPGKLPFREHLKLMGIGAIQFGVMYLAYIYCFSALKAYQAAIFTIITPIYVILFDSIIRKRFSLVYLIAALLSVIGALVIKYEGISQDKLISGFLTMQIANIAFAFGQVCYASWKEKNPSVLNKSIFASLYLGALILTAIACLSYTDIDATVSSLNASNITALIYLGIIASGIGFFLWNIGASKTKNPGTLAVFNNMLPPAAALVAIAFFGEYKTLSLSGLIHLIAGTAIIFASLFLNYINPAMFNKIRSK